MAYIDNISCLINRDLDRLRMIKIKNLIFKFVHLSLKRWLILEIYIFLYMLVPRSRFSQSVSYDLIYWPDTYNYIRWYK